MAWRQAARRPWPPPTPPLPISQATFAPPSTCRFPYVPFSGELAVVCSALLGSCLGFLWWNAFPARVFMGDTGSLAIGGMLGAVAICCKQEILLVIVGGVFVIEAMSVILQVASFKITAGGSSRCRRSITISNSAGGKRIP